MSLKNLIDSGFYDGIKDKDRFRIRFVNSLVLAYIPLYIVYIFINYKKGFYGFALLDTINVIILVSTYIYLKKTSNIEKATYGLLISPLPIFLVAFFQGGVYNSAFFWFFLFPIWALFLKGNKVGLRWIVALFVMIILFYEYAKITQLSLPYNINLLLILLVALSIESFIVSYFTKMRKDYDTIIESQNKSLAKYQRELESKVVEQEQEIVEIQRDIIFTMGSIGESRSKETANHVRRVAGYSQLFAKLLNFKQDEILMIYQASPMHDIGKVGIADSILNKPGKLTNEEFDTMKTHSQLGYDLLKDSKRSLLKMAAIIAYGHHEKWDGSGYPNKLKGEDIHIYGRITAIADVFDALGSDRIYKKAWQDEKIFALLKEQKGKHFDPTLIDIFFDNLDEFLKIRDTYVD